MTRGQLRLCERGVCLFVAYKVPGKQKKEEGEGGHPLPNELWSDKYEKGEEDH
jgi:hypothetical protein